jgi:hypothetical protein
MAPLAETPGGMLARGVCRWLVDQGAAPVTEFSPTPGLRVDVAALLPDGRIAVVECKSCPADFRSDRKWAGYLEWCDAFWFAVPVEFPSELLPAAEGMLRADPFGAFAERPAQERKLPPARRRALTLRIGRAAAFRLRRALDPDAPPFPDPG